MEIQEVALSAIKPYWRNPRDNRQSVDAVAQSIRDYGFNVPIVVDKEFVILAGHTRYKALQMLGWDKVPVIVADLPAQKAKEFRIADNKTSDLGEWDFPKLVLELKEIAELPNMDIYFPDLDLQSLVDALPKTQVVDVDDAKVNRAAEIMASDYTTRNAQELKGLIPMICPDCGYEYSLSIDQLQFMIDGIRKQIAYGNQETVPEL